MKRQSSTGEGPSKRALMGDEGILRHKNRQLGSALKLAKNELSTTQTRLRQLETDRDLFDATTSVLDRAWKLLDSDLASIVVRMGLKPASQPTSTAQSSNSDNGSIPSSSRLVQVLGEASDKYVLADVTTVDPEEMNGGDDEDEDERLPFDLEAKLKQRIQWTTSLLTQVLEAVAKKENGFDLQSQLLAQTRSLTARVQLLGSKLIVSRKKIKELQSALEEAKGEVWRLTRRLDSMNQEDGAGTTSTPAATSSTGGNEPLPPVQQEEQQPDRPVSSMSKASSPVEIPVEESRKLVAAGDAELKASLDEMTEIAASRLAQLDELRKDLRTALSTQTFVLPTGADGSSSSSSSDLQREIERQKQQCAILTRQTDRAYAISHLALQKLADAEARIDQLESASDAIIKVAESTLSKENAQLKQALEETKKLLEERASEAERYRTLATAGEEREKMIKSLTEERSALRSKLEQQRDKSGSAEGSEALINEIEQINTALNDSRESCSRLQAQIVDMTQRIGQLQTEKAAMESDLREIREEKNALSLRSEKMQSVLHENEAYVARLEERLMSEKAASQKAEEMARSSGEQCEKSLADVEEMKREVEMHKERAATIPQLEEMIRNANLQTEDIKSELSRSEEDVKRLNRRLERAKAALEAAAKAAASSGTRGPATSKSIDEERLEAMTHALRCPVYQHLWKDCVITKCAHMFSRRALEDNLAQRNRKCPSCKNTYSKDDILNVYLYQSNDL